MGTEKFWAVNSRNNLLAQMLGHGIGKLAMFIFYITLPRLMGLQEYGRFAFAFAIASLILQPALEMGLDIVATKWVARGIDDVFRKVLLLRGIIACILFLPFLFLTPVLHMDVRTEILLFLHFALSYVLSAGFAYLRGKEEMRLESFTVALQKITTLLILFLLYFMGFFGVRLALFSLLGGTVIACVFFYACIWKKSSAVWRRSTGTIAYWKILREGLVLGGVTLLWMVYFRVDSAMLGVMKGNESVGVYNVAYKLLEGVLFFPGIIMIVYFPKLAACRASRDVYRPLFLSLFIAGMFSAGILYLSSPWIIQCLYNENYWPSVEVLKILAFAVVPIFLGHIVTQTLVALDANRIYLIITICGVLGNLLLNAFLIPGYGPKGAATATAITESCVTLLCVLAIRHLRRLESDVA